MDCLFCKIADKRLSSKVVYEDDKTLAFLDVMPKSPGHTMVIPKFHTENLLDLPDEEITPLFTTVKKVAKTLNQKLNPSGFTIGINHGKISGQTVPHLHIHIIPRYDGDGGGSIHSVVNNTPSESLEEILIKIKR